LSNIMAQTDPHILKDAFGRTVNNLRISVTDRCNFRCRYCMPEEGMVWLDRRALLTYEEISRLVHVVAGLGVTKIRLTGGEPLMRQELHLLVEKIARIPGIEDIALTTNGFFLAEQAVQLCKAGLTRVTVSLDSLQPGKFSAMVRRDYFGKVWEALEIVEKLPLRPIKINAVIVRGMNDDEIENFAQLARTRPFHVRFIEFMPIGADDGWTIDKVFPTREIIERINAGAQKLVPVEFRGAQPADRYRFDDGTGEIGFISSVSEPFCSDCNRIRLTSDGKLLTCLFSLHETDLKTMMRNGSTDEDLREAIMKAVWLKEEGHLINRPGFVRPERTMSQIGG